jgi:transposase
MITPEIRAEMRRLVLRLHWRIETVARRFGVHHSTVRRALENGPQVGEVPSGSILEPYKAFVVERITDAPELTSIRLLAELKERGYPGGVAVVRRYLAKVRHPRPRKMYLRIETEPGEQAQVDWGSFGHLRIGSHQRPLSAFAMVLSWSRALFIDFSLDQRMETFLAMHRRALEYFGGVPRRCLYDNLKSVVLHHVGSTVQFNPTFLNFAGHYLFEPTAAPVRYPEAKGRVENAIKYVRSSFFYGRSFSSLEDLRQQAAAWLENTANARLHATTRERPADRLLVERPRLHALPEQPFDTNLIVPTIVSKEARVRLDSNSYSVPPELVGKMVHVRADATTVRIAFEGQDVAQHERSWERHRAIENPAHIEKLLERRKAARSGKRKDRFMALSPEARLYVQQIARSRISLDHELRKLTRLAALYGEADVAAAMGKALSHRTFGARYVRALIDQSRFAAGLGEPPEPIVTGNAAADALEVQPHALESYDELVPSPKPNLEPAE